MIAFRSALNIGEQQPLPKAGDCSQPGLLMISLAIAQVYRLFCPACGISFRWMHAVEFSAAVPNWHGACLQQ